MDLISCKRLLNYVEANHPSLENRRIKIGMQYATTLKAYPSNPAYDCVCNPLHEYAYDKQPKTIQAFGPLQVRDVILDDKMVSNIVTN
jgi:hypothetical protein